MEMKNQKTISEQLAEKVVALRYSDLPELARKHARILILDMLGNMIGSKRVESSRIAAKLALEMGGPRESTVIGYRKKVSAPVAAFANAIQSYAFDFADDQNSSNCHPSVATIPGSLALGQKLHSTGQEIITAVALGNEVVCRLGTAFLGKTYYQGFHPSSTCGVFGTAVSAAKLLKLDEAKTVSSLGIAGSQSGGLMEWNADGSIVKRLQAGHPSMCGLMSGLLAEKGFHGPRTIIEGDSGFLNAYSFKRQYDKKVITQDFGRSWLFAESSIKAYPCCRYSGGHIDACIEIADKHRPDPKQIKKIKIRSSDYTLRLLTLPLERKLHPTTTVDAQFSMPYQAVAALIDGKVNVDTFTEKYFTRPSALALIPRVEWTVDKEFERRYPEQYSCSVTVIMNDGKEFTSTIDNPKGDFRNPMTQKDIIEKFSRLVRRVTRDEGKIKNLVNFVMKLETAKDINDLFSLLP